MDNEGLQRFVKAQEHDFARALWEIKNGRKMSHWMWYIFPQLQGLGHSMTAQYYAIKDRKEAEAYMNHPILGGRLLEISGELLKLKSNDAGEVLGWPDDMKLKSSMTLFETVSAEPVFGQVLDKFFGGERDRKTLDLLMENEKVHTCQPSYDQAPELTKERLENQKIFSQKYQVYGKWKFMQSHCFLQFTFEEEQVQLPFDVTFSEKTLPWLAEAAVMKIEGYIENILFDRQAGWEGGSLWDE